MVPKVIHHIVGPKQNKVVRRCLASWKVLAKEKFVIRLWNDELIISFIKKNYPFALNAILTARNHAEVADIARYLIVHHHGGHYYDWDIQLLDKELFISLHNSNLHGYLLEDPTDGSIASEAFSAKKGEPYLHKIIEDIIHVYEHGHRDNLHTLDYSGPFRMRETLKESKSSQQVLAVKDVFLYDYHEIKVMPERADERPMIHYWLHSWL